jgi:ATP-dependent Clp protease ATP-binding subunit ClpB
VVLFDEIEKAHSEVFDVLLQILDDGRLTDSQGRTVDFKNVVIILTSNVGSHHLARLTEKDDFAYAERQVLDELRGKFKPEFLNRIDDTVVFRPLTKESLRRIVDVQLERVRKLLGAQRIDLTVTDPAKDQLAEEGWDPAYGARPLKRVIATRLQDALAVKILEGSFGENDHVVVDVDDGELVLRKGDGPADRPTTH